MNKLCCLIVIFITCGVCDAQYNLVPNPSFENYDTCPTFVAQIYRAVPWTNPNNSSPDYFNACSTYPGINVPANFAGYESARTGIAYAGIATYANYQPPNNRYREYIQIQLIDSLISGTDYCIQFYVSACDSNDYVSNNLGIYFSTTQIFIPNIYVLPYVPQFENPSTNNLSSRNGWTLVSGQFVASGGEKFIVIGNFRDTATTVVTYTNWATNPGYFYAEYYVDDVLITPCDSLTRINENNFNTDLTLFPNPFTDQLIITIKTNEFVAVTLYDVTARKLFNQSFTTSTTINTEQLAKGIYLYEVRNKNGVIKKGKVVKD